jgi:glucosylceramidase
VFMSYNRVALFGAVLLTISLFSCDMHYDYEVYQTSANGDKLAPMDSVTEEPSVVIKIGYDSAFQQITGFGGAFTESSAYLLNQMSPQNRDLILKAYFSAEGANYSLCRTHFNSCDFSLHPYSYDSVPGDTQLIHFSIDEDRDDLIPMIKSAQEMSENGFKLVASPWTAPPWMKDNNAWFGGKLLPEYYPTWALFFSKYAQAYRKEGIDIWAFTVENEPLGNNSNWESMHYTPEEMADFTKNHLAPQLLKDSLNIKLLMYDQNRGKELVEWAEALLNDTGLLPHIYGTAVHWYNSTYDYFPESLQRTHTLAPDKHIIETEGCIDAEIPHWQDDEWYWKKEATDWGWDWAEEENKHFHPKYVPAFRYARDIIGCMNNHVEGWIDWNMVLDDKGGPNHAKNWCIAPVLVKPETDEVYFTPLYYIMAHFSKFVRPGAYRLHWTASSDDLMVTHFMNSDDSSEVLVVLNTTNKPMTYRVVHDENSPVYRIDTKSLQTMIIRTKIDESPFISGQ